MSGAVKYGCEPEPDDMWRPVIEITNFGPENKTVIFTANFKVKGLDDTRKVIEVVHGILSGPQKNMIYDRNGNADRGN